MLVWVTGVDPPKSTPLPNQQGGYTHSSAHHIMTAVSPDRAL